jgi:hypothetical protein
MRTYLIPSPTTQKSLIRIFDKLYYGVGKCTETGVRVCIQLRTCRYLLCRDRAYYNTTIHRIRRVRRDSRKPHTGKNWGKKRRDTRIKDQQDVDLGHFYPFQ